MKIYKILATLLVTSTALTMATAQVDLITVKAYAARAKENPNLVLVDGNKPKNYEVSHIKGAISINHMDMYLPGDVEGINKSPDELAAFFGSKGLTENSEIVLCDDGSQKYSTTLYWTLKYLGATNVRIMHKDLDQCRAARIALTAQPSKLPPAKFTPAVHPEMMAVLEDVKTLADHPDRILVDCRAPEEFAGTKDSDGHIPGAINLNHLDLLTASGAFRPVEELKTMVEKMGITPDKEVILYCKTGVRAAVAYVVFKNILGYERVKVYEGAYTEWKAAGNAIVQ